MAFRAATGSTASSCRASMISETRRAFRLPVDTPPSISRRGCRALFFFPDRKSSNPSGIANSSSGRGSSESSTTGSSRISSRSRAGVGAAAGLGYGVHRLNKHYQKKNEAALGRQRTEMGLQKKAFAPDPLTMALGPLGAGATMGLGAGKALSGPTANMATPRGNKVKAEAIAKKLAIPTAVVGALAGMYLMHGANSNKLRQMAALKFPKLSRGHLDVIEHALIPMFSGMGGGAVAGIATGLAVAGGFRAKSALFGKTASTKERLIGAGAGALTLGGAGALKGYMDHRPGPSGKSRAQFEAQGELDRMKAVFEHQGKDTENLPKMDKARHRYAELKVKAMADGQQSPGRSAAISGLAGGLVGGVTGGLAGPHVGALARRIR